MCGIAGEVRFDQRPASLERVQRMTNAMRARGPEGQGVVGHGRYAFGHRRLKIIDLSDRGQQPMEDPLLGLTLVFNGCIYNHKELRRDLESKGYQFFSTSDSEVILKSYHAWGEHCVERFNGMFAFVIYERDSGRVFMARDRLGIKPLYYQKAPGVLRFASSLPALLKGRRSGLDIDPGALHHYMMFHSVVPAPRTIIKGICKLAPATAVTFEPHGTARERRYWDLDFDRELPLKSEAEIKEALLEQLRNAVSRRLIADVPVGVLLSGGVDSSLITGLLAEAGAEDLQTFSVGFEDVGGEKGNEFDYSDIVARHFGTTHHKIEVDSDTLLGNLEACFQAMSEPMVSHDNIGFFLLSKHVSQHVKVVQSGQGADEVFGGYHWYPPLMDTDDALETYRQAFFDRDQDEYQQAIAEAYAGDDVSLEFVREHFAQPGASHAVDKALRLDTTVMLVDDPVKRVDNMTMAWGLEARVPFLDHELVEFAAAIPAQYKVGNSGKHILKEAAREIIPDEVIDRPKGYFPVPALKYLEGGQLDFVRDVLSNQAARKRGLFKQAYLDKLLANPGEHITPLRGSKLWQAATLEYWLQSHGIE
ncbi:asparagine synthase (glutamine-hydrolyzing) [Methylohalomonas lacus]|uniref:asparagine synthase (glutamine-hydrolyzing) n=1 Tax=Methylohalomonas lacus TaxID=398773 RepID=A0AAE3L0U6_9GAMM|nr:N-acetylglutaminylglutamine amidotransferase [Methylohalomonas lacus]MCS3903114.1 asparagine synthase (glutamine-hydrolyzing) [Methylohalomonas lacus]